MYRKRPFGTHGQGRRPARATVCRILCLILCLAYVRLKSMARRTVLTSRQRSALFSLPPREADDPGGVARDTPSVREQSSRGFPPPDASAGAPDATLHVGRLRATVRVGTRNCAESLSSRSGGQPADHSPRRHLWPTAVQRRLAKKGHKCGAVSEKCPESSGSGRFHVSVG